MVSTLDRKLLRELPVVADAPAYDGLACGPDGDPGASIAQGDAKGSRLGRTVRAAGDEQDQERGRVHPVHCALGAREPLQAPR